MQLPNHVPTLPLFPNRCFRTIVGEPDLILMRRKATLWGGKLQSFQVNLPWGCWLWWFRILHEGCCFGRICPNAIWASDGCDGSLSEYILPHLRSCSWLTTWLWFTQCLELEFLQVSWHNAAVALLSYFFPCDVAAELCNKSNLTRPSVFWWRLTTTAKIEFSPYRQITFLTFPEFSRHYVPTELRITVSFSAGNQCPQINCQCGSATVFYDKVLN